MIYSEVRKTRKLHLSVVGGGPLRNLPGTELGDGVRYYGNVPVIVLAKIYAQSSIFISAPQSVRHMGMKIWEEQFGWTLVEAMASGLPIVSTDCGAVPEVIGSNNLIVHEDSISGVKDAKIHLVDNPMDAKELGIQNRGGAENVFNAKLQSEALEQFLLDDI